MKKYFSPWGGILVGSTFLLPYLFFGMPWNGITYFVAVTLIISLMYVILEIIKKRKKSKNSEE